MAIEADRFFRSYFVADWLEEYGEHNRVKISKRKEIRKESAEKKTGRPKTEEEIRKLILKLARENSWAIQKFSES